MDANINSANVKEIKYLEKTDMSLFGTFEHGSEICFSLTVNGLNPKLVSMVIHADGWGKPETLYREYTLSSAAMTPDKDKTEGSGQFTLTLNMAALCREFDLDDSGLFYYHYRFDFEDGSKCFFGGERPSELEEINGYHNERQLLVYAKGFATSEKLKSGIIYQIFVDRFKSSGKCPVKPGAIIDSDWKNGIPQYGEYPGAEVANNVFFGGDLYGIAEKLDYIKSLGTSTIYLCPVFDAASNHKYDTSDYLSIDEMFGGEEALKYLCEKAAALGIEIMLDGVFNHTGSDSIYFNMEGNYPSVGAYQSKDSPYYSWYFFKDFPDEYDCWWGVKILPKVDTSNEEYKSFIFDKVIKKWMAAGVSGWRLDVADELDNGFLCGLRNKVKELNPDGPVIGEVWEDASDKVSYGFRRSYLRGHQLDSVMNYPLRDAVISYVLSADCEKFRRNTETQYRRYPKQSSDSQMNFLGTHDTVRILTMLGDSSFDDLTNQELSTRHMTLSDRKRALRLLKLAYGIIVAVPGVPCIFYGDEIGMEGYRDPFCRKPFPWHKIDENLLGYYQKLGEIRRTEPVLKEGLFRIEELNENYLVIRRYSETDEITVVANRSDSDISYALACPSVELITGKTAKKSLIVRKKSTAFIKRLLDK